MARDPWMGCPHCPHFVDNHIAVQVMSDEYEWHPADGQPYRCSQCECTVTMGPEGLVPVGRR